MDNHRSRAGVISETRISWAVRYLISGLRDAAVRVSEAITAGAERFAESTRDADEIARCYHWCVSTSWPLGFVVELAEMGAKKISQAAVDRRLLNFYLSNDWHELDQLTRDIVRRRAMSHWRRRQISDVVKIIRAGDLDGFNAATFVVPTLFAQLEGILRDFARDDLGLTDETGKLLSIRTMIEPLRPSAFASEEAGIDPITRRLWKYTKGREALVSEQNTRHFHLHGHAQGPLRKTDAVRLVLMIDLVTTLIDRHRNAVVEYNDVAIRFRALYAELLSCHAAAVPDGHESALTFRSSSRTATGCERKIS